MTTETRVGARSVDIAHAVKDAVIAGLVTFGLLGPFVGLLTRQDMQNRLVLDVRPELLAILVAIVMVGRFLLTVFVWAPRGEVRAEGPRSGIGAAFRGIAYLIGVAVMIVMAGDLVSRAMGVRFLAEIVPGFEGLGTGPVVVVAEAVLFVVGWLVVSLARGPKPAAVAEPADGLTVPQRVAFMIGLTAILVFGADIAFRLIGGAPLPGMPPLGETTSIWAVVAIEALAVAFGFVLVTWGRGETSLAATLLGPAGIGFLAVFPVIAIMGAGWGGSLKWIDNFGIQILIYVMLGWGLNIVVGLAGLLDLGYVAFYAVGAYSYALLAKEFGLSFWILLPLAGILAAFWGVILGFPVLRLRGDYLAIVTLAFGEIIRLVLINWVDFSGGYAGISGIPRPTLFGIPFNASDEGFAARFGLEFSPIYRTIFLYYVILCLALLTAFVTVRMRRMPVGRAWEALREDEIACRSLGINTTNTKLTAFALGAMFGGFAGSFFAARQGFISPESFTFLESAQILAIVVLGGMGSLYGVVIAAVVLVGGFELMRELDLLKQVFGAGFDPTHYRGLIFGASMVLIMLWKPRGLISSRSPTAFLKERKAVSGSLVKEGHG